MTPVWEENGRHRWECPAMNCPAKGSESSRGAAEKILLRHLGNVHGIR